jgi:hypothetical protein
MMYSFAFLSSTDSTSVHIIVKTHISGTSLKLQIEMTGKHECESIGNASAETISLIAFVTYRSKVERTSYQVGSDEVT